MSELFASGIRPAIDEYLLKLASEKRSYGEYWSASSAGYCHRKLIFERLGVPHVNEDDPRLQRVFSAGHIFHSWIQKLTREAGISIAQETELKDEQLKVIGHFDDLVSVGDKLILYDYKTVNSRSFMWARTHGNEMSWYHRLQLATYMYMLRKLDYREPGFPEFDDKTFKYKDHDLTNLTEARILKIEKDSLMIDEQQLLGTPELEQQVLKYWTELNQAWKSKIMPPCTCADHENGFMAKEKYNPFFYKDSPCSLDWFAKSGIEYK